MRIKGFWETMLPFLLLGWGIFAFFAKPGWLTFIIGCLLWVILFIFTAPGVFWTTLAFINTHPDQALNRLRKAVRYQPAMIYPYFTLGIMSAKLKNWDEAIPLLEKTVAMASDRHRLYYQTVLAEAYRESGAAERALAILNALLESSVQSSKIYTDLAITHLRLKNYSEALNFAEKARALDPSAVQPVLIMGQAHLGAGEYQKAKEDYEWAIARIKYPTESYYWLSRAELELGNKDEAVRHLQRAVERISEDPLLSDVTLEEAQYWLDKALGETNP